MQLECAGITIDLSRQPDAALSYVPSTRRKALDRAQKWIAGDPVNDTENRPAMHMALRAQDDSLFPHAFVEPVLAERERQKSFVERVKEKDFLHIGVGGSILGPQFVHRALSAERVAQKQVTFLSSLSPSVIRKTIEPLDPNKTLCLIGSKTLATAEIKYITDRLKDTFLWPDDRFVALTAAPETALLSRITPHHTFPFWHWVGGRYSVWSSIGLPIALSYGWEAFEDFLAGARMVDRITCTDVAGSIAFKLAGVLYAKRHLYDTMGLAVLPYHADLHGMIDYLQQLIMESNGKPSAEGKAAPIIFGSTGTEFQHSFGQYLQQGPDLCCCLFLTVTPPPTAAAWEREAQTIMNTNAIAQADTLWHGRNDPAASKNILGGRPSIVMNLPDLSPYTLGALLALMEYVTVLDGFLSDINPFDQWGVEAGKQLARLRLDNGS